MGKKWQEQKQLAKKKKVYTLTQEQIDQIKQEATTKAMDAAFALMLGLPVMVIHDHMGKLWKKEVNGVCREERLTDYITDLYDSFEKGYITLDDVHKTLEEECGINFIKVFNRKKGGRR